MSDSHTLTRLLSVSVLGVIAAWVFLSAFAPVPSIYAG